MAEILLVEDNRNYSDPATQHLTSEGHDVLLTRDYNEAVGRLANKEFYGVITDCFFPFATGSGNAEPGIALVERMADSDPHEARRVRKMTAGLKVFGQYVDLGDPDMLKYAQFFIGTSQEDDISQSPVVRAIIQVNVLGKEATTLIAKNTLGAVYREDQAPKDHYGALRRAISESEANQPLGLLVAEKAEEAGLPLILTTSTYHHDLITQPVQNFASRKGWTLVDCGPNREDDKASPEFWERALSELERKLD